MRDLLKLDTRDIQYIPEGSVRVQDFFEDCIGKFTK